MKSCSSAGWGRRWAWWMAVAVAVVAGAAMTTGCGGSDGGDASTVATTDAEAQEPSDERVALEAKTIGFLDGLKGGPFQKRVFGVFEAGADELGWNIDYADGEGNPQVMADAASTLISKGVDALVISSVEPAYVRAALQKANQQDIPVITVGGESEHDLDDMLAGVYTESEEELTLPLAAHMKETLDEGDKVAIFKTDVFLTGKGRADTLVRELESAGIEIAANVETPFDFGGAEKKVTDTLSANAELDAVVPVWDIWTAPALNALKSANRSETAVFAFYADEVNVPLMHANENVIALVDTNASIGAAIALDQLAAHFATGAEIDPAAADGQIKYEVFTRDDMPPEGANVPPQWADEAILEPFVADWRSRFQIG